VVSQWVVKAESYYLRVEDFFGGKGYREGRKGGLSWATKSPRLKEAMKLQFRAARKQWNCSFVPPESHVTAVSCCQEAMKLQFRATRKPWNCSFVQPESHETAVSCCQEAMKLQFRAARNKWNCGFVQPGSHETAVSCCQEAMKLQLRAARKLWNWSFMMPESYETARSMRLQLHVAIIHETAVSYERNPWNCSFMYKEINETAVSCGHNPWNCSFVLPESHETAVSCCEKAMKLQFCAANLVVVVDGWFLEFCKGDADKLFVFPPQLCLKATSRCGGL
jgi:hypothetical protein